MAIRPSGVMKTMNAANTTHQFTGWIHGASVNHASTLLITASQVTHCSPVRVVSGTDNATCARPVRRGVGRTMRFSVTAPGLMSSSICASEPSRGWS